MNRSTLFCPIVICAGVMFSTACAAPTPAGQEVADAIGAFCDSLREMNNLMAGVTDRATADAVTSPLRQKTKEMYQNSRRVKALSLKSEPNDEDQAVLMRQVLELQLLQAEFERHCLRLAEQRFYDSVQLARLFHAIAELYQRDQNGTVAPPAPPAAPKEERSISEEERQRREQRRNERLKLYYEKGTF